MTAPQETLAIEVLVVEDNPGDVRLTEMALSHGTIPKRVSVTRDGEAAMAFLRQEGKYADARRPQLILLDLNLPRKNGYEVLEEIKHDPVLRSIPVVILTTSDHERDVRRSYDLSANCFVTKPVGLERYLQVVGTIEEFWLRTATLPPAQRSSA